MNGNFHSFYSFFYFDARPSLKHSRGSGSDISVITNTDSSGYTEEIPTLVVIFVGATITVLVLVTMLIIGNAMKRRISVKTELQQDGQALQIKNIQVNLKPSSISFEYNVMDSGEPVGQQSMREASILWQ